MSKLETNTIDTVSGTNTLQVGSSNVATVNVGASGDTVNVGTGATVDSSNNLKFNSGYGSVATAYGVRAWVNFNGTGTVAIRGSGNVSSVVDTSTGRYTINFTNNMPDVNYNFTGMVSNTIDNWSSELQGSGRMSGIRQKGNEQPTTSSIKVETQFGAKNGSDAGYTDYSSICVTIFR